MKREANGNKRKLSDAPRGAVGGFGFGVSFDFSGLVGGRAGIRTRDSLIKSQMVTAHFVDQFQRGTRSEA